jgi:hypothetical protein
MATTQILVAPMVGAAVLDAMGAGWLAGSENAGYSTWLLPKVSMFWLGDSRRCGAAGWCETHTVRSLHDWRGTSKPQGLITFSPAASKGVVSRVATVNALARATAAMKASAVSTATPAARDLASSSA